MSGTWSSADLYDRFMGRWSRALAAEVITRLDPPSGLRWLDIGCGTGSASAVVLDEADPQSLIALDPSADYVTVTRTRLGGDPRLRVVVAGAEHLPVPDASVEMIVSGLVLNFVADPVSAMKEMHRVLVPGGRAVVYVWDYSEGMQMLRHFWDAAIAEDPAAARLDEGARFPLCHPKALTKCFTDAGMRDVTVTSVEVPTSFRDFDDYWDPFLGGQGPAGVYCRGLSETAARRLRDRLLTRVPVQADGSLTLSARAWVGCGSGN